MLSKELQKTLDNAEKVKAVILEKLKPLRLKEAELQKKFDKINKELRTLRESIVAIEQPDLAEASRTITTLSSKCSKKIKAESGVFGVKTK